MSAAGSPPPRSVLGVVCGAAGVLGSGGPEAGTDVSRVEVRGDAVGACCPALLCQRTDPRSDRSSAARQTGKGQEEVTRSEVESETALRTGLKERSVVFL